MTARVGAVDAALVVLVVIVTVTLGIAFEVLFERADARRARRAHPSCRDLRRRSRRVSPR